MCIGHNNNITTTAAAAAAAAATTTTTIDNVVQRVPGAQTITGASMYLYTATRHQTVPRCRQQSTGTYTCPC